MYLGNDRRETQQCPVQFFDVLRDALGGPIQRIEPSVDGVVKVIDVGLHEVN